MLIDRAGSKLAKFCASASIVLRMVAELRVYSRIMGACEVIEIMVFERMNYSIQDVDNIHTLLNPTNPQYRRKLSAAFCYGGMQVEV